MSEHDPLCPYANPCPEEWRNDRTIKAEGLPVPHRIVSGSSGRCVECDAGECICDVIAEVTERAVQRVGALMPYPMNHATECAWFKNLANECDCTMSKIIAAIKGKS